MNNSMISAKVSMSAIQQRLDLIADNIANVNTVGYKRKEATFEDTLTRVQQQASDMKLPGRATPLGFNMGFGSQVTGVAVNFLQGTIRDTGRETNLAILGDALFVVQGQGEEEQRAYTRAGDFHIQPNPEDPESAFLVTSQGYHVMNTEDAPIEVPAGAKLQIDPQGNITATVGDTVTAAGTIALVTPQRKDVLVQKDGGLFVLPTGVAEGDVLTDIADLELPEGQQVQLRQGALESSNVDLATEMAEMLQVQRAYQLSARALTSSDTMMGLANNLRG